MRYFVFNTESDATKALETVNLETAKAFIKAGYSTTKEGWIIGKTKDGEDNPKGVTKTWDIPWQRLDGKWVISHPENQPMKDFVAVDEVKQGDVVTKPAELFKNAIVKGVTKAMIEEYSESWIPTSKEF